MGVALECKWGRRLPLLHVQQIANLNVVMSVNCLGVLVDCVRNRVGDCVGMDRDEE